MIATFRKTFLISAALAALGACSSYPYARNVRLVAFTDQPVRSTAVGPIQGSDCTWWLFDNRLGDDPSLERAVTSAQTQRGYHTFNRGTASSANKGRPIAYLNNVRTEGSDANYWIVRKQCMVVKGQGFK